VVAGGGLRRPDGGLRKSARPHRRRGDDAKRVHRGRGHSAHEIAELLERHHIKRVPVLSGGWLAGIVSRANLLHGLANTIVEHHEPGAAKDRQLRKELVKILLDNHKLDSVLVNVTVSDGNVRLWGVVENADEAAAAESAARSLPGVKSVENNLGLGPMSGVPV